MRDPHSIEAEHSLLGAMMQRPDLIDTLSEDLSAEAFYFPANAEVYRSIMAIRSSGQAVDFLTVGNHIGSWDDGSPAFAYCAEIVKNTPSIANARTYAQIVRDRAIDRALYDLGSQAMEISQSTEDIQAKIAAVQAAAMAIDCGSGDDDIVKVGDVLIDQLEVWQERHGRHTRGETLIGLSTGLKDLDEKLGGLQPDHLYIVAGRPAMGKTTLAMGFVVDAAVRQCKSALVISCEMNKGQLLDRAVASEGRIPLTLVKNGTACETHGAELAAAAGVLRRAPLYIADRAGSSIGRIRSLARRHKMRYGLDLLMIDYLQLLEGEGGKAVVKGLFYELACTDYNGSGWVVRGSKLVLSTDELVTQLSFKLQHAQREILALKSPSLMDGLQNQKIKANRLGAGGTNYTGD